MDDFFQSYLTNLATWESTLLDEVTTTKDIFTAMEIMSKGEFLVTMDGSSGDTDMSFGWKISAYKGISIAIHAGLAFGQLSSFQAEAYEELSVMCFLLRAAEYTKTNRKLSFRVYSDNEGVIKRIQKQKS
eukprot:15346168-Ditylum_brightwellii.AAC.1